jgi:hypothetical protein
MKRQNLDKINQVNSYKKQHEKNNSKFKVSEKLNKDITKNNLKKLKNKKHQIYKIPDDSHIKLIFDPFL